MNNLFMRQERKGRKEKEGKLNCREGEAKEVKARKGMEKKGKGLEKK